MTMNVEIATGFAFAMTMNVEIATGFAFAMAKDHDEP